VCLAYRGANSGAFLGRRRGTTARLYDENSCYPDVTPKEVETCKSARPEGFEPPTLRSEVFRGVIRNPANDRDLVITPSFVAAKIAPEVVRPVR
jgi:hypothetical protein